MLASIGTTQGNEDHAKDIVLAPEATDLVASNLSCSGKEKYYITVHAINNVQLKSVAYSNVSVVDTTPPRNGSLSLVSSYRGVQLESQGTIFIGEHTPCLVDASVLTVIWSEFTDAESSIVK